MNGARMVARGLVVAAVSVLCCVLFSGRPAAHCDSMRGPVITEARAALEKGDVTPILKWVKQDNEAEIRTAFARTVAVRARGAEAKELADRFFLETLVRLHRAGEGAPYTGIKDEPIDPIVAMADKALVDGTAEEMIKKINSHMAAAIGERFKRAVEARKSRDTSVEAGREFVEAYVTYMHHVEAIHAAIASGGGHEHTGAAEPSAFGMVEQRARKD